MSSEKRKILVVDDEQTQLETMCRGLFLYGFECRGVSHAKQALEVLGEEWGEYDLVLTDLTMPEWSGLELIDEIEKRWPSLPIIVFTGLAETSELEQVRKRNIPYLRKPFQPDELVERINAQLVQ